MKIVWLKIATFAKTKKASLKDFLDINLLLITN